MVRSAKLVAIVMLLCGGTANAVTYSVSISYEGIITHSDLPNDPVFGIGQSISGSFSYSSNTPKITDPILLGHTAEFYTILQPGYFSAGDVTWSWPEGSIMLQDNEGFHSHPDQYFYDIFSYSSPTIDMGSASTNPFSVDVTLHLTAINELPPRCREVFELSRVHGLRYAEIASAMDISIKTVEVHRHNILKKLKVKNTASLINYINASGL